MISRRNLLKKMKWRKQIDLNLDFTEYDETLDSIVEKHASPEDLENLCTIMKLPFFKDDLKTTKQSILFVFHNQPGLAAVVVGPILKNMGVILLFTGLTKDVDMNNDPMYKALTHTFAYNVPDDYKLLLKIVALPLIWTGYKISKLNGLSKQSVEECRGIIAHILTTMSQKEVLKEMSTTVGKSRGGTRRTRRVR